jgi:hypothetical protein
MICEVTTNQAAVSIKKRLNAMDFRAAPRNFTGCAFLPLSRRLRRCSVERPL